MHATILHVFSLLSYLGAALLAVGVVMSHNAEQAVVASKLMVLLVSIGPIAGLLVSGALLGGAGKAIEELQRIRVAVEASPRAMRRPSEA